MNRITAVFLAMAALLVHVLVLHRNAFGDFAAPYDSAHAAYQLGRMLVREGQIAWSMNVATGAFEGDLSSYPSPLLVWVAATFEWLGAIFDRGHWTVTRGTQMVGIACVMVTVFLSTRFDTDRIAGVVPALLLVTSGAVAAAGASGTEWPLVMVMLTAAFVALEHGRERVGALALTLLVTTSVEGVVCALVLLVQTSWRQLVSRRRGGYAVPPVDESVPAPQGLMGFAEPPPGTSAMIPGVATFFPAAVALAITHGLGASFLSDFSTALQFDGQLTSQGFARLADFLAVTASPILLGIPLIALVMGELSGTGRRALALSAICAVTTALLGGGAPASFGIAFTPALAIAFIAIQQGIARALDTYRRGIERGIWVLLSLTLIVALLASRFPGDLGQIKVQRVQEKFYAARAETPLGGTPLLARQSQFAEIRLAEQLREVGVFLRDRLPDGASIMTPWPGALSYLTRHRVIDLFGRTTPLPGKERALWSLNPPRADVLAALELEPDYIVPSVAAVFEGPDVELIDLLSTQLFGAADENNKDLVSDVKARLSGYEPVVTAGLGGRGRRLRSPLVILRKRGIQRQPQLVIADVGEFLEVRAGFEVPDTAPDQHAATIDPSGERHFPVPVRSLPQIFDANVELVGPDGRKNLIDPHGRAFGPAAGELVQRSLVGIVIDPTWDAFVTLARIPKANVKAGDSIRARLLHHRLGESSPASAASDPLVYSAR